MVRAAMIAVIAIAPAIAAAQPSPTSAAANAQFDRGRGLMKEGKYAEAYVAFEQSQKLEPQWGTLYNLAICAERIGKLASAWSAYRELAARDTNAERRRESRKQVAALDKRLPRLRLAMSARPPGVVVTLYGVDVTGLLGYDNPIDLGAHPIQVRAPGHRPLDTVAKITEEGKTVTVELAMTPEVAAPPARVAAPPPAPAPRPVGPVLGPVPPPAAGPPAMVSASASAQIDAPNGARAKRRRTAMFVGIGGGALAATSVLFGWSARRNWSEAKALCGDDLRCDTDDNFAAGEKRADRARLHANLSTGFMIGGAAAVGVAAYFWFTAPRERTARHALRIAPSAGGDRVGLVLDGSF